MCSHTLPQKLIAPNLYGLHKRWKLRNCPCFESARLSEGWGKTSHDWGVYRSKIFLITSYRRINMSLSGQFLRTNLARAKQSTLVALRFEERKILRRYFDQDSDKSRRFPARRKEFQRKTNSDCSSSERVCLAHRMRSGGTAKGWRAWRIVWIKHGKSGQRKMERGEFFWEGRK
jgi:hypothetical protein